MNWTEFARFCDANQVGLNPALGPFTDAEATLNFPNNSHDDILMAAARACELLRDEDEAVRLAETPLPPIEGGAAVGMLQGIINTSIHRLMVSQHVVLPRVAPGRVSACGLVEPLGAKLLTLLTNRPELAPATIIVDEAKHPVMLRHEDGTGNTPAVTLVPSVVNGIAFPAGMVAKARIAEHARTRPNGLQVVSLADLQNVNIMRPSIWVLPKAERTTHIGRIGVYSFGVVGPRFGVRNQGPARELLNDASIEDIQARVSSVL